MNFPSVRFRSFVRVVVAVLIVLMAAGPIAIAGAQPVVAQTANKKSRRASTPPKKGSGGTAKGKTQQKGTSSKGTTSKKGGPQKKQAPAKKNAKPESRDDMQKRQQQAQREIQLTKEQIAENDRKVKSELATLRALDADITVRRKRVDEIGAQISTLSSAIDTLERSIATRSDRLDRLRSDYLLTIKKMRMHRNSTSTLAFIFAASDFNQALRRLRYLKQVSAWRARQSQQIRTEMGRLSAEKDQLARSSSEKDHAMQEEVAAREVLEQKHAQQDAVVVKLKSNGAALQSHLKRKQAEANDLRNRIAAIIAEEQRKAEAAEKARQAEEARRKAAAEEAARKAEKERSEADKKQKSTDDKKEKTDKKEDKKGDYAEARKRAPRGEKTQAPASGNTGAEKSAPAPAPAAGASFAQQKGSLPAPTSGSFRIVSPFGRHALPSLPNVEYDNPGVDAETSSGASAIAVYPGKVSGVYMLPGYSTVVIVNHGQYYTVYGNIASAAVKVGDQVRTGQSLGRLAPDPDADDRTMIHFEVWHNREKLNPAQWLR